MKKITSIIADISDALVFPSYCRFGFRMRSKEFSPTEQFNSLQGRSFLITGANAGIGFSCALSLAKRKATVHLVCRDQNKGERAQAELKRVTNNQEIYLHILDVSLIKEIRQFCKEFIAAGWALHGLIHNAGVLLHERTETAEGLETTFATNVAGPYLLTKLLLPVLEKNAPSRVIFVSSGGMYAQKLNVDDLQFNRTRYRGAKAYAQTKRAEVLLAARFSKEYSQLGISFHSMHPGWVRTTGVEKSLPFFYKMTRRFLRTPAQGADTILWLATSPEVENSSGKFWFDRKERKINWPLMGTQSSAEEIERLWEECERLTSQVKS